MVDGAPVRRSAPRAGPGRRARQPVATTRVLSLDGVFARTFGVWARNVVPFSVISVVLFSPLIAYWRGEIGSQNHVIHVWAYNSMDERARVRVDATKGGTWPPNVREFLYAQETKILEPASFSPLK